MPYTVGKGREMRCERVFFQANSRVQVNFFVRKSTLSGLSNYRARKS
jgi:hypothetical protein